MRTKATLACIICQSRNYVVDKNKQTNPQRLERKKFCRVCNKHTLHKETR